MSGEFFRFWRYIQRFALGTILCFEILLICFGLEKIKIVFNSIFTTTNDALSLLGNAVILIGIFLIFGVIGTLTINVFVSFISAVSKPIVKKIIPIKSLKPKPTWLVYLFNSAENIALKTLQDNVDGHIEHFSLRSLGEPQPKEVIERIATFYKRLKNYILNIKDYKHFFVLSYQGTLTQEQRNLDNFEWDVNSIRSLLIIVELGIIILYLQDILSLFLVLLFIPIILIVFCPEIVNRKRKYISYLIANSGAIFQLAESGDIADRESI